MMIKSVDVNEGDTIWARDRRAVLGDLRTLDQRIAAMEAINGPGAWQNCMNCLSELFFWGLGEVTSDDGDDTYTLKPKYISNVTDVTADAMTTADMDTGAGIKPEITATAVGTGDVAVEDEFLVFGGFDAGEGAGEPIVRYFFEARGGASVWQLFADWTYSETGNLTGLGDLSAAAIRWIADNTIGGERRMYFAFLVDGADDALEVTELDGVVSAISFFVSIDDAYLRFYQWFTGGEVSIVAGLEARWITESFNTANPLSWDGPDEKPAVSAKIQQFFGLGDYFEDDDSWGRPIALNSRTIGITERNDCLIPNIARPAGVYGIEVRWNAYYLLWNDPDENDRVDGYIATGGLTGYMRYMEHGYANIII